MKFDGFPKEKEIPSYKLVNGVGAHKCSLIVFELFSSNEACFCLD
jgi:hypothetical protein